MSKGVGQASQQRKCTLPCMTARKSPKKRKTKRLTAEQAAKTPIGEHQTPLADILGAFLKAKPTKASRKSKSSPD